ncbi:carbohydrate ABC transporter permease [Ktedonospora formicarum]|uniref:Sugar ABC transporter permease n=1 Tax=Ktedonospora formicarum TaxID=2778364 RepID=A0A8J3HX57_9CHLR|nr:carbohydrate ABC transporter permease [Ktedonospora formicarum]GHO42503.1 sugar ABC transporter permease [Ktedonospora formicarum]
MASIDTTLQEAKPQLSPAARNRRRVFFTGSIVINLLLLLLVILTVIPFLYMVLSAFKPNAEIFGSPITLFPRTFTLDNMGALLSQFPFARWMLNTAITAFGGTIVSLLLSSLAGFAFAKYDFRFKNLLFTLMLVTLLIPPQVLQIPQFEVIRELHWFNTYQALIVPRAVGAFGIFLMRQYTMTVPNEILDSARVDGASEFTIWWRIVLPLVRPGLAVLGILTFTGLWNDFYWPLIVTTDPSMFVANLGIAALVGPYDYQYGILLSGAVLASIPIILMFLIFQRQFIAGLTQGAVK